MHLAPKKKEDMPHTELSRSVRSDFLRHHTTLHDDLIFKGDDFVFYPIFKELYCHLHSRELGLLHLLIMGKGILDHTHCY